MASITFGRFTPYKTFTHKMDPRNKLLLMIALIVAVFLPFTLESTKLILSGCYLLLAIILMIISRVSFLQLLNSLKGMWLLILFIFAIYMFIPNKAYDASTLPVLFTTPWNYAVKLNAIFDSVYIILRLIIMMGLMMVLTSTTKPMDLTYAFEWYMTPLKWIHFPVHEIAMTLSIALRFIPTLLDETERIMKAQSSRGVDFNHGSLLKRFKAVTSLILPLFISAIERSEELANAMEVRGYDPRAKRTKFRVLHFSWRDLIGFLLVGSIVAGIIVLFCFDKNVGHVDLIKYFFNVEVGF